MKKVTNKLRVHHYPQIPCKPFIVDVKDEYEAYKIIQVLADQHLFLLEQNIIPDYSNSLVVMMLDDNVDEWCDYWNYKEERDWDEIEQLIEEENGKDN